MLMLEHTRNRNSKMFLYTATMLYISVLRYYRLCYGMLLHFLCYVECNGFKAMAIKKEGIKGT